MVCVVIRLGIEILKDVLDIYYIQVVVRKGSNLIFQVMGVKDDVVLYVLQVVGVYGQVFREEVIMGGGYSCFFYGILLIKVQECCGLFFFYFFRFEDWWFSFFLYCRGQWQGWFFVVIMESFDSVIWMGKRVYN